MKTKIMNTNTLKLIAMITMFVDHLGYICFPEQDIFRCVGRIAFPIYAFLIAEGYCYTKDIKKYRRRLLFSGLTYSVLYYLLFQNIYISVLLTFYVSILIIMLYEKIKNQKDEKKIIGITVIAMITVITMLLKFDYAPIGTIIPLCLCLSKNNKYRIIIYAGLLALLATVNGWAIQYFGLLALIPLALYNGKKGKLNLKTIFYIFYPLHIIIIKLLSLII